MSIKKFFRKLCILFSLIFVIVFVEEPPIETSVAASSTDDKIDILFLSDTTGSMSGAINDVRNNAASIMNTVRASRPDTQFGAAEYKDFNCDVNPFLLDAPNSSDLTATQTGVDKWVADGGCDTPEAQINALYTIATDPSIGFRTDSMRFVVWFGDASGHDPSNGHSLLDTVNAIKNAKINVIAVPVTGADGLDSTGQATTITSAMIGGKLMASTAPNDVANAILAALSHLPPSQQTVREAAIEKAKSVIGGWYTLGAKGWDYSQKKFVSSGDIVAGNGYIFHDKSTVRGVDCSGLVLWSYDSAYNSLYYPNPANADEAETAVKYENADGQYRHNTEPIAIGSEQPGDLMFFDWGKWVSDGKGGGSYNGINDGHIDHVAMYVGGSQTDTNGEKYDVTPDGTKYNVVQASFDGSDGILPSKTYSGKDSMKLDIEKHAGKHFVGFGRINDPRIGGLVKTNSPIDLVVSDPDGVTITPNTTIRTDEEISHEIPGELYYSIYDTEPDGSPKTEVYWPKLKMGNYTIRPIKRADASTSSVYGISIITDAGSKVIAENVPINDIPETGYGITVSETGVTTFVPTELTPYITDESADSITPASVTIKWKTDHPTTSRVVYDTVSHIVQDAGPSYGYASSTTEDSSLTTDHSVVVSGLASNTTYYFRAISHGSPEVSSNEITASTLPEPNGTLVVTKDTLGGDGTFSFTGDAGAFSITTTGGIGSETISSLPAGTYTVTETPAPGWTMTTNDCTNVIVTPGATANCTVINAQQGHIIVKKMATGAETTDNFSFVTSYAPGGINITAGNQNDSGLLDPGTYAVSEDVSEGWTLISSTCSDGSDPSAINLDPGETVICTFTNDKKKDTNSGVISGMKFEDLNGNGKKDSDERGLTGWVIYVDTNNNGKHDRREPFAVTNGHGQYSLRHLPAGTYTIREIPRKGWIQTFPKSNAYTVKLSTGQIVTGQDFGNFKLGEISGMKFEDVNGNGKKDHQETGIQGWTIQIKKPDGKKITTLTDKFGRYRFDLLSPGNYEVTEVQKNGWTQKTTNPATIVITSGAESDRNDFGNQKNMSEPEKNKMEDKR